MSKRVTDFLRKGQRGFTLIELVAVMAILAILVAIVAPAGMNAERASITAQAQADSPQVRDAAVQFFTNQNESEVRTPHTVTLTTKVNSAATSTAAQIVSSRWPEMYITQAQSGVPTLDRTASSEYNHIFETATTPKVFNVVLLEDDGTTTISGADLLSKFTAIDLEKLVNEGLLSKMPDGADKTSATGITGLSAHNFLWLFIKQDSSVGDDDNRVVAVFALEKVDQIEASSGVPAQVNLTYEQILGPDP